MKENLLKLREELDKLTSAERAQLFQKYCRVCCEIGDFRKSQHDVEGGYYTHYCCREDYD